MQQSLYRLWIAIAVSTLTIGSSLSVSAKPQLRSTTAQHGGKQPVVSAARSPVFAAAKTAKVGNESPIFTSIDKSSRRQLAKIPGSQQSKNRPNRPIARDTRTKGNDSFNGIAHFTHSDRNMPRSADVSAVNSLIE